MDRDRNSLFENLIGKAIIYISTNSKDGFYALLFKIKTTRWYDTIIYATAPNFEIRKI